MSRSLPQAGGSSSGSTSNQAPGARAPVNARSEKALFRRNDPDDVPEVEGPPAYDPYATTAPAPPPQTRPAAIDPNHANNVARPRFVVANPQTGQNSAQQVWTEEPQQMHPPPNQPTMQYAPVQQSMIPTSAQQPLHQIVPQPMSQQPTGQQMMGYQGPTQGGQYMQQQPISHSALHAPIARSVSQTQHTLEQAATLYGDGVPHSLAPPSSNQFQRSLPNSPQNQQAFDFHPQRQSTLSSEYQFPQSTSQVIYVGLISPVDGSWDSGSPSVQNTLLPNVTTPRSGQFSNFSSIQEDRPAEFSGYRGPSPNLMQRPTSAATGRQSTAPYDPHRQSVQSWESGRQSAQSYRYGTPLGESIGSGAASTTGMLCFPKGYRVLVADDYIVGGGPSAVLIAAALNGEVAAGRNRDAIDDQLVNVHRLASQSDKECQKLITAGIIPTLITLLKTRAGDGIGLEVVLMTLGLVA